MTQKWGRRDFIRTGVATSAVVGAGGVLARASTRMPPSDQVVVGVIGMGRQGMYNMSRFAEKPDVKIAAVCDVYQPHLDRAIEESGAQAYHDFRRILDRNDIDAVVFSTPDHWHPLMTVMACQAGKDVYVEKPISVVVSEGRKMVQAARRYGRVIQVGTMQRSGKHFQQAARLVQQGEIGKVTAVRSWNFGNDWPDGIGNPADTSPPEGLDWDLWLGPAPKVPFNANRFGVFPDKWSTFRYFWDYAGGMMTDWGVHLLDIVQWAMKVDAPESVLGLGGKFALHDNRDTPDTLTAAYHYPGFICTYENRVCNGRSINRHGYDIEFYGTQGTLYIDRSGFDIVPETDRHEDRRIPRMYAMQVEATNDSNYDHVRDFLDCIKSRGTPICDIEVGHYSTTTCLLANVSYRVGRRVHWDGKQERIIGDREANTLLDREYRAPWKLEV